MVSLRQIEILLAAIGLGIAIYLLLAEPSARNGFSTSFLFCPDNGTFGIVNCAAVLTSKYSYVFGMPLAGLAAIWFALLIVLFALRRRSNLLNTLATYLEIAGILAVAYSAYAMHSIGKVCIYCSSIDLILLLLFGIGVAEARRH